MPDEMITKVLNEFRSASIDVIGRCIMRYMSLTLFLFFIKSAVFSQCVGVNGVCLGDEKSKIQRINKQDYSQCRVIHHKGYFDIIHIFVSESFNSPDKIERSLEIQFRNERVSSIEYKIKPIKESDGKGIIEDITKKYGTHSIAHGRGILYWDNIFGKYFLTMYHHLTDDRSKYFTTFMLLKYTDTNNRAMNPTCESGAPSGGKK